MMTYSVAAEATQYSTAGLMWKASLPSLCPMISPASVQVRLLDLLFVYKAVSLHWR